MSSRSEPLQRFKEKETVMIAHLSKHLASKVAVGVTLTACLGCGSALAADRTYTYINGVKTIVLPKEYNTLKDGTGVNTVVQICTDCHSTDYISTQPYQTRDGWQAVITKMRDKFGMDRISANDEATILDYLVTNYGQ
jgi:hypothetical protein